MPSEANFEPGDLSSMNDKGYGCKFLASNEEKETSPLETKQENSVSEIDSSKVFLAEPVSEDPATPKNLEQAHVAPKRRTLKLKTRVVEKDGTDDDQRTSKKLKKTELRKSELTSEPESEGAKAGKDPENVLKTSYIKAMQEMEEAGLVTEKGIGAGMVK
eukprot:GHVP01005726.1.p1 GENE.GHVP01005726.1~~GHVP01005726.1.p1  ORF type:complete len:160 (+),score=45.55 GHVP01005726.1:24-503(+)